MTRRPLHTLVSLFFHPVQVTITTFKRRIWNDKFLCKNRKKTLTIGEETIKRRHRLKFIDAIIQVPRKKRNMVNFELEQ